MLMLERRQGDRVDVGGRPLDVVRIYPQSCVLRWLGSLVVVQLGDAIDDGRIKLVSIRPGPRASLGFEYPRDVVIMREELLQ